MRSASSGRKGRNASSTTVRSPRDGSNSFRSRSRSQRGRSGCWGARSRRRRPPTRGRVPGPSPGRARSRLGPHLVQDRGAAILAVGRLDQVGDGHGRVAALVGVERQDLAERLADQARSARSSPAPTMTRSTGTPCNSASRSVSRGSRARGIGRRDPCTAGRLDRRGAGRGDSGWRRSRARAIPQPVTAADAPGLPPCGMA